VDAVNVEKPPPSALATAVWMECTRCGHWWLVPRRRAAFVKHFVGPCCRG